MASGIPKWRNAHDPTSAELSGEVPFPSFLFVDDGILIEPNLGTRCTESALCWEKGRRLTFGPNSANHDKLEEEGNWSSVKLVLGYLVGTNNWAISIPEGGIRGAHSSIRPNYLSPGNRIPPLQILQELRGNIAHWPKTGWIWHRLVHPIYRMLGFSDASVLWVI